MPGGGVAPDKEVGGTLNEATPVWSAAPGTHAL